MLNSLRQTTSVNWRHQCHSNERKLHLHSPKMQKSAVDMNETEAQK
jgi:hypothetical protein